MELMHKTYTCEWTEEELMSDGEVGPKKSGPRTYYQYVKSNELKRKLAEETVILAFTVSTSGGWCVICIAHGHERKTGVTNVVEMAIKQDELSKRNYGSALLTDGARFGCSKIQQED